MGDALKKLLLALLGQAPLFAGFFLKWDQVQQEPIIAALIGVVYEMVVILLAFGREVWAELKPEAVRYVADSIRNSVRGFAPGFYKRYKRQILYNHEMFNVRGLGLINAYALKLEQVFVDLEIAPSNNPERLNFDPVFAREIEESQSIWDFLRLGKPKDQDPIALAIIGPPGSGKTTILQHVAQVLAVNRQRQYRVRSQIPVLLFLRDFKDTLIQENAPNLGDLAQRHFGDETKFPSLKPPAGWFDKCLRKSRRCLVLLDGLDEVGDLSQRQTVSRWVDHQITNYPNCQFILTSRPQGYRDAPLHRAHILEVQAFNREQMQEFVHSWYLANEIMRSGGQDHASVRNRAKQEARDFIGRIGRTQGLEDLTVNPLLLTMITMVHYYRGALPEGRVELYAEICKVLLESWRQGKELPDTLKEAQKLNVLQPLALHMMCQKTREISISKALEVIASPLMSIGVSEHDAEVFLKNLQENSGLLLEREAGQFGFAHQTFQEYLAAREIATQGSTDLLVSHFGDAYWQETMLLYAGLGEDASDLLMGIISCEDGAVAEEWRFVMQLSKEALIASENTRRAFSGHPLQILKRTKDAHTAVRASLWLRRGVPSVDVLIAAFDEAENDLAKGHFAMLLGEVEEGKMEAIEALKPHLDDDNCHVRCVCALALDHLNYQEKDLDKHLMVKVSEGRFIMGSQQDDDNPEREGSTESYEIDRFPLTVGQYRKFVEAGGYQNDAYWSAEGLKWQGSRTVPLYWDDQKYNVLSAPVVGISWYEAEAYGNWCGKRLLNEEEWERACRGEDGREYPWVGEFDASKCNVDRVIGQPSPVGGYPGGVSPYGCYDMSGNVWEWTSSSYSESDSDRVLRGGSWFNRTNAARCAFRLGSYPVLQYYFIGVRFSRTL